MNKLITLIALIGTTCFAGQTVRDFTMIGTTTADSLTFTNGYTITGVSSSNAYTLAGYAVQETDATYTNTVALASNAVASVSGSASNLTTTGTTTIGGSTTINGKLSVTNEIHSTSVLEAGLIGTAGGMVSIADDDLSGWVNLTTSNDVLFVAGSEVQERPTKTIVINGTNSLPTPADWSDGLGTVYHMDDGNYQIGNDISLDYPMTGSTNAGDTTVLYGGGVAGLTFTMTNGAAFVSSTSAPMATLSIDSLSISVQTNGTVFDINGAETIDVYRSLITGGGDLGSINDPTEAVSITDSTFSGFNSGLSISNSPTTYIRGVGMVAGEVIDDEAFLTILGTSTSTAISDVQAYPSSGDAFLNISSSYTGIVNLAAVNVVTALGGVPFSTNSIDQTDPRVGAAHCSNIQDSGTYGGFSSLGNTTISDYQVIGEDLDFESVTDLGGGEVQVNSAETGLLADGSIVWIKCDEYMGKYTITNLVNDTSFDITATFTATSSGEIDTGWIEIVGATVESEDIERCSMTSSNTLTFTNIEPITLRAIMDYSVKTDSASVSTIEICMMVNDEIVDGSISPRQLATTVAQGFSHGLVTVVAGDEIKSYTRNKTAETRDLIADAKTLSVK